MLESEKKSIIKNVKICAYIVICLVVLHLAFFSLLSPARADNQAEHHDKLKTYVVYEDLYRPTGDFPYVSLLIEYLGHFDVSVNQIPIPKWTSGSIVDADLVVYVGLDKEDLPRELLAEMAKAKQIIWFENNIEQLAEYLKWSDFRLGMKARGWSSITLEGKQHNLDDSFRNQYAILTSPGQKAEELATISNENLTKTLAWKRDNVYFCGFLNFETEYFYILANLLHRFIPNNHAHSPRTAFLRIEDVNPLTSPNSLKSIVDVVVRHKIPFAIGVVPANVTEGKSMILLHEKPVLVKILQDAQKSGAAIIMHGYTHQNVYSPTTGEGYEFWNFRDDKPMEDDANFTRERLQKGIAELVRSGLTPVAFEPPHYAMSKTAYNVLSEYFNIFSGQIQLSDETEAIAGTLPYITHSTYLNGMLVIPENLGYVDGVEFTREGLFQNLSYMKKVNDGLAGLFYHGYLPSAPLDSIITSIKKQGYKFLDIRQFPIKVQSEQITITGTDGKISVSIDSELKASWRRSLMTPIIVASLLAIAIFTIFRLRRRKKTLTVTNDECQEEKLAA